MKGGMQASDRTRKRPRSRYAVLGMLSMGLETGYAMKKHVEANLGHFWNESYGQIYPILRQLVEEGLATCQVEQQAGARRRKCYALTPAGGNELRAWLVQPPEPQPPRLELLLKLSFGERVPVEACEQLIRGHRETCDRDIAHLAGIESTLRDTPGRHPDQPYWLMTLRYGRAVREAERAWCDEALEQLQEIRSGHELTPESGVGR
jgi:PadR family transcriptional regulator AphA